MGSSETKNQIGALEQRLIELRKERFNVEAEVDRLRSARGRARLLDDGGRELATLRKSEAAAEASLQEIEAALAAGAEDLRQLQERLAMEVEAERFERDLAEMRAIAAALPKVAEHIDAVLAVVREATHARAGRRGTVFAQVAHAFARGIDRVNRDEPSGVKAALEVHAREYAAAAARGAAPNQTQPARKPLPLDIAVYALKRLVYRDAGDGERIDVTVPAGTILLVPAAVAEAAAAVEAAEILERDPSLACVELVAATVIDGRQHPTGWQGLVPADLAGGLIATGKARPLEMLTPGEVAAFRIGRPADRPRAGTVDLGRFNDPEADARRALDQLAQQTAA